MAVMATGTATAASSVKFPHWPRQSPARPTVPNTRKGRSMAERDYASTPVADALGLRAIIDGLASDLQDVRAGTITPADAMARAALAKQIFNGCRLYLNAMAVVSRDARNGQQAAKQIAGAGSV